MVARIETNYKVVGTFTPITEKKVLAYQVTISYSDGSPDYIFVVPATNTSFTDWHSKQNRVNTYTMLAYFEDHTYLKSNAVKIAMGPNGEVTTEAALASAPVYTKTYYSGSTTYTGSSTSSTPSSTPSDQTLPPIPSTPLNTNPPKIGSCQIFPSDNPWNTDISNYPVHPNSANFISSIGASGHLHADF